MRKEFKLFATVWGVLYAVIIFGVIVAVQISDGMIASLGAFWAGYAGILVAFLGQFICGCVAFKEEKAQKFFYNIPLIKISWSAMIFMFFVGFGIMLIPGLSNLVGALICLIILAIDTASVMKAKTVATLVAEIDDKIKVKTFFIKSLTVDAEELVSRASSEEIKAECTKVYEAIRYSDPMSNDALSSLESEITIKFATLSDAVKADDVTAVVEAAKEVIILVENRNKKCKLLK